MTPAKEPAPNSTRATGTQGAVSPVTTGARRARAPKTAAFTSGARTTARTSRGERSAPNPARGEPPSARSPGTPHRIPSAAGTHGAATARNAARHPAGEPGSAPPGTPTTVAAVGGGHRLRGAEAQGLTA
ncbi:hypothetical protein GCM10010363_52700 [Streptomyces omiyaensis]|nr:hypothetical protein GCM10010363_52700 [Streptomyces omiyaensis]